MRALAVVGYYVCWVLASALISLLLGTLLWMFLEARFEATGRIDDDWVVLVMPPLGAALGILAARRTRESRVLHRVCRPLGLFIVLAGIAAAVVYFEKAEAVSGTGMLAGLGEAIIALFFVFLALIGALMVGIGTLGAAARPQSPSGE